MSAHSRRRRSGRSSRPLAAGVVLVVGLVLTFLFAGVTVQENALAHDITALQQQISTEQARNQQLQADAVVKASSDYVIDKAREFGFVWPWETLIAVQRNADANARAVPADQRPPRVVRWIALFFGRR